MKYQVKNNNKLEKELDKNYIFNIENSEIKKNSKLIELVFENGYWKTKEIVKNF